MKHLLLDVNIALDLLFRRGNYKQVEQLIRKSREFNVPLWFSTSSLAVTEFSLINELKKEGTTEKYAKNIARQNLVEFLKCVSLLSNYGFDQDMVIQKSFDIKEAQAAISFSHLHGEKRIVTNNARFDTLGMVKTCSVSEAIEWITQESEDTQLQFIDLKAQQDSIRPRLEKNIHTVLGHGRYILGPEVKELEQRLCEYTGAKHCIGVSSGTDALLMPLMAWGIGPGDAVFTTPFTFIATAEVIQLLGATPVFVDIDPQTFNMDPQKLELAIRAVQKNNPEIYPLPSKPERVSRLVPKAIIPVDLFGLPADYDPITSIAENHGLKVLADSAQGFGSQYKGRKSGTLGHATATSFFPAKPLGGYGDGGAIFTNDDRLAETLESIRVHGKGKDKYDNVRIGLNARLDTLQASILLAKLDIFDKELEAKERLAKKYNDLIAQNGKKLKPQYVPPSTRSSWAQYSLLTSSYVDREKIQKALKASGIPCMVYYPKPLHMQTAFDELGYSEEDFPVSKKTSETILSLPMHGYMDDLAIQKIGDILRSAQS